MKARMSTKWILAGAWLCAAVAVLALQDQGPNLKPQAKPKPVAATLLVICDLACDWRLDGKAMARVTPGDTARTSVGSGQHVVVATTEDGTDRVKRIIAVKSGEQVVVDVELQPVRDARLKPERERQALEETSRDPASVFAAGIGPFHFGISPAEVSRLLSYQLNATWPQMGSSFMMHPPSEAR